jgi:hypothetical protein
VQTEVLAKHPEADLKVYAIWFDMIPFDMRARTPTDVFADRRVVQFWDGDQTVGRWYGQNAGHPDDVWWDTFLLYGRDARWVGTPSPLLAKGSTIWRTREDLAAGINLLYPSTVRHE